MKLSIASATNRFPAGLCVGLITGSVPLFSIMQIVPITTLQQTLNPLSAHILLDVDDAIDRFPSKVPKGVGSFPGGIKTNLVHQKSPQPVWRLRTPPQLPG